MKAIFMSMFLYSDEFSWFFFFLFETWSLMLRRMNPEIVEFYIDIFLKCHTKKNLMIF